MTCVYTRNNHQGELAALRAADGRAASPGREGAIDPLKEEASLLG